MVRISLIFFASLLLCIHHSVVDALQVGDQLCIEGFIMDYYCINNVRMIDNGLVTLEEPDRHTVHCLVDVGVCVRTAFEVLVFSEPGSSTTYSRGYRLDDNSKADIMSLARSVGSCSTCTNGYDSSKLNRGFRAVMKVTVLDMNPNESESSPPLVRVDERRDSSRLGSDPCQSEFGIAEGVPISTTPATNPPTLAPGNPSTPPPSMRPTPPPSKAPTAPQMPGFDSLTAGSLVGSTLEHKITLSDPNANGQDTITIRYTVPQTSWVAVGVNPTGGGMVNAEAVIGKPSDGSVLKYKITAKNGNAISELPNQTLINPSLQQTGDSTILTFTKLLVEDDEFTIAAGASNTFVAAFGFSNNFGFHQGYGVQAVMLEEGEVAAPTVPTNAPAPTNVPVPVPTDSPTSIAPFVAPTSPPGAQTLELTGELAGSTLSYQFTNTGGKDSITVTYTAPVTGWVAVGASESGLMVGSDAVIGIPATGEIKKYALNAKSLDGVSVLPDEKQTLANAAITQANGMTTLTYTKILVENGEIPINRDGDNIFVAAHGSSNTLGFHSAKGAFKLSGEVIERDDSLWGIHGLLAFIAWGVLCPLAILAGLFRKFIPGQGVWFIIHRTLQGLVVILTIASVAVAIVALNEETPANLSANHFSPDFVDGHRLIGLVVLIVAVVQGANGIFRPHLPPKPEESAESDTQSEKKSGTRKFWEVLHRLLGVGLLALTWYQIYLGIFWYSEIFNDGDSESSLTVYYAIIGVLGGFILIGVVLRVLG